MAVLLLGLLGAVGLRKFSPTKNLIDRAVWSRNPSFSDPVAHGGRRRSVKVTCPHVFGGAGDDGAVAGPLPDAGDPVKRDFSRFSCSTPDSDRVLTAFRGSEPDKRDVAGKGNFSRTRRCLRFLRGSADGGAISPRSSRKRARRSSGPPFSEFLAPFR